MKRAQFVGMMSTLLFLMMFLVQGAAAEKQVLHIGLEAGDLSSLDPARGLTSSDVPLISFLYSGLVRFPDGKVTPRKYLPDLAEHWESSQDGLTWTFRLAKGVPWHRNNGEVTAEDVKYSLGRSADKQSKWHKDYMNFREVTVVDRYTIKISLNKADPFFLSKVANWHGGLVVCKKVMEKLPKDRFLMNPVQEEVVGTGPFMFESYTPKEKVVLVRNEQYHLGKPTLEKIVNHYIPMITTRELALTKGDVHMIRGKAGQSWVDMMRNKGIVVESPGPNLGAVLHFNTKMKPLDDIRVRKALCHAMDRRQVVQFLGDTITSPMLSPIPNGYHGQTSEGIPDYDYNPDKAKKLLAEAGYPDGFKMEMFVSEWDWYKDRMVIIQEQL